MKPKASSSGLPAVATGTSAPSARYTSTSRTRITSYARSKTLSRKSPDELKSLRAAGLNRIHTGMESGSDAVLSLMHKGVTQEEQIRSGRQVVAAGIELSEYFMPGLGGQDLSGEHAVESANVLNAVNPTFIRIRTTVPVPGTPLHRMMTDGQWMPMTEEEKVRELRACLERLDGITSTVQSDHMMNLLEDMAGRLPDDRQRMIEPIDRFLNMNPSDREAFIVGRRSPVPCCGWPLTPMSIAIAAATQNLLSCQHYYQSRSAANKMRLSRMRVRPSATDNGFTSAGMGRGTTMCRHLAPCSPTVRFSTVLPSNLWIEMPLVSLSQLLATPASPRLSEASCLARS